MSVVDDHVVIFGGCTSEGALDDTWTINLFAQDDEVAVGRTGAGVVKEYPAADSGADTDEPRLGSWKRWRDGLRPARRAGHTLATLGTEHDKRVVMLGGSDVNRGVTHGDMWIADAEDADPTDPGSVYDISWDPVEPPSTGAAGREYTARWNHTCTAIESFLFVFGGEDPSLRTLPGMHMYSVPGSTWMEVRDFLPQPPARQLHVAASVNNNLYLFSGRGAVRHHPLTDVWVFDTEVMRWREIHAANASPLVDSDGRPAALEGACCAVLGSVVYLFGGRLGRATNSKMFRFDTVAEEWGVVTQTGDIPDPRTRASCAQDPDDHTRWIVFGGACDDSKRAELFELTLPEQR